MPDKHFDPFKSALAERIENMQKVLHGVAAESELIRERVFRPEKHLIPRLNTLYDSERTPNAWRYTADISLSFVNQIIPGSPSIFQVPLTLPNGQVPNWRLEQWPNAVSLYQIIQDFGATIRIAPTTTGSLLVSFLSPNGYQVFIGAWQTANFQFSFNGDILVPNPITDTGNNLVGTLVFNLLSGTTVTIDGFINLGAAYLLPSAYGYDLREDVPSYVQKSSNGHIIAEGTYTRDRDEQRKGTY